MPYFVDVVSRWLINLTSSSSFPARVSMSSAKLICYKSLFWVFSMQPHHPVSCNATGRELTPQGLEGFFFPIFTLKLQSLFPSLLAKLSPNLLMSRTVHCKIPTHMWNLPKSVDIDFVHRFLKIHKVDVEQLCICTSVHPLSKQMTWDNTNRPRRQILFVYF